MATNLYQEAGSSGLEAWHGFVQQAYEANLYWPTCYPVYNRIRRSDPEIGGIVRPSFTSLASDVKLEVALPKDASEDDKRFGEFVEQVLEDIDGGQGRLLETIVSYAPFMGWQWFDAPLAMRKKGWRAPKDTSGWTSNYNDGLIGLRGLYHRDHSSFERWEMDDKTGRVSGMWQVDYPNPRIMLPLDRSLHITFGDPTNPEGLSPLEAVWRLERIKYGLEVVQGIGYEHTAGYVSFKIHQSLSTEAKAMVAKAARALMSAQQGNYITEIAETFEASIIDTPFQSAAAILEAIRYYGILKLQVYNMQWVAMATTSGSGAYSAVQDSSSMFVGSFNAMMAGFAAQIDQQVGQRLLKLNAAAFPGITQRPRIVATPIEKAIPLTELASFVNGMMGVLNFGDDDRIAIRRKSGFLPETPPEETAVNEPAEPPTPPPANEEAANEMAELAQPDLFGSDAKELAARFADRTEDEIAALYKEWLTETEAEMSGANDENERRELAIAAVLLLSGRVRALLLQRMAELSGRLMLNEVQLKALQKTINDTVLYFDQVSMPQLRYDLLSYEPTTEALSLFDKFRRKARDYSLLGGVLWSGYVAAKLSTEPQTAMGQWDGPNDEGTCAPCRMQMWLGVRPLAEIPLPGIGVCLGLSGCRHDIVVVS